MTEPSLWQRVRRARLAQVLAVYLGASWLVLQIADTLVDALGLPDWVLPVAVILLLVGMVVILSTAWVQSLPTTTARERAGEVPRDWQLAPRDALSSLLRGRLPHLTWGRVLTAGVVALSLLFGSAGIYVGVFERGEAGAERALVPEAAEGIAVVPFDVRGQDLDIWREGMMDLLTNGLDGVGGFRTVDSRTVMARWRERVGDSATTDLPTAQAVAASTGARYALAGSVVALGGDVRLVANVYDLETGEEVAQGHAQGPVDDVLRLADELTVGTMRELLGSLGREAFGALNAETLTTPSVPALRSFLEAESEYRRGRFAEAVTRYDRAVSEDTAFAMAYARRAEAYAWLEEYDPETLEEYVADANARAHRLPARQRAIVDGLTSLLDMTAEGVPALETAVRNYPDDPELSFLLAETYLHIGEATFATVDEIWEALRRAVDLDPGFAPYRVHLAEVAVMRGDRALAERTLDRFEALGGERWMLEHVELAIPLLLGDSAEHARALGLAREMSWETLAYYHTAIGRWHDQFDREYPLERIRAEKEGVGRLRVESMYAAAMGRLASGSMLVAGPAASPADRAFWWAYVWMIWGDGPPGPADPGGTLPVGACDDPEFDPTCHVFVGIAATEWERHDLHVRAIERLREEAERAPAAGPGSADQLRAYADIVEGAGLWRRGERAAGRALLERHAGKGHQMFWNWEGDRARIELAWLEAAEGRPAAAIPHFRAEALHGWDKPIALYALARMYSLLGRDDDARHWYGRFATLTRTGDDLPRIREARTALPR